MNRREQEIFMRGIAVAFEAMEKWETEAEVVAEKVHKAKRVWRGKGTAWTDEQDRLLLKAQSLEEALALSPTLGRDRGKVRSRYYFFRSKSGAKKLAELNSRPVSDKYDGLAKLNQKL